jgi:hypothetical protein
MPARRQAKYASLTDAMVACRGPERHAWERIPFSLRRATTQHHKRWLIGERGAERRAFRCVRGCGTEKYMVINYQGEIVSVKYDYDDGYRLGRDQWDTTSMRREYLARTEEEGGTGRGISKITPIANGRRARG